jgi:predicted NBD/HSP70 family sugar kinase
MPRSDDWAQSLVDRPATRRQLAPVGRWLGIGLANIVNIFNPAVIVLGGHFAYIYPLMGDAVNEQLATALSAPRQQVRVEVAKLGADSVIVGAAEMAFAALLADPLGHLERMRAQQVA